MNKIARGARAGQSVQKQKSKKAMKDRNRPKFIMVPKCLWNDSALRSVSDDAKLVFLCLVTSSRSMKCPGLLPCSPLIVLDDLGWADDQLGRVKSAWEEMIEASLIDSDAHARLVYLPCLVDATPPSNENVLKGWRSDFDQLPDSPLKSKWLDHAAAITVKYTDFFERYPKAFPECRERVSEPFRKTETIDRDGDGDAEGDGDGEIERGGSPPLKAEEDPAKKEENERIEVLRLLLDTEVKKKWGDDYKAGPPWNARQRDKARTLIESYGEDLTADAVRWLVKHWKRFAGTMGEKINAPTPNIDVLSGFHEAIFPQAQGIKPVKKRLPQHRAEYDPDEDDMPSIGWG